MRSLVIYLNELSCVCEGLGIEAIRPHVVNAIAALQDVGHIRRDTSVRLHQPLRQITCGMGRFTLAEVLPGQNDRFSVLKRYVDKNPCDAVPALDREVRYKGQSAIGLGWADQEDSFVMSLGHTPPWSNHVIPAERQTLDAQSGLVAGVVEIRNLATRGHAEMWRADIEGYGKDIAKSSLLYRGNQFVMRMHLDDHDPAHVHIYAHSTDTRALLAKVRIDNGDILEGALSTPMRREIGEVLARNREALMEGWDRCRSGQLPFAVK